MSVVQFRPKTSEPDDDQVEDVISNPLALRRGRGDLVPVSEETLHLAQVRHRWLRRIQAGLGLLVSIVFLVVGGYLFSVIKANRIGDDLTFPQDLRQVWSSPWAGVSAMIVDREMLENGWSPEAPEWAPVSRLTAMPAYQSALVEAIGQHTALASQQTTKDQDPDPDLQAAARLLTGSVNTAELRAAREALASYDGRVRLHKVEDVVLPSEFADRLDLMADWSAQSGRELLEIFNSAKGVPLDDSAVMAVYRGRARAYLAHRLIWSMNEPYGIETREARDYALRSWEKAARFEPLVVLNGGREALVFPSHAAAMRALLMEAETATRNYAQLVRPASAVH